MSAIWDDEIGMTDEDYFVAHAPISSRWLPTCQDVLETLVNEKYNCLG